MPKRWKRTILYGGYLLFVTLPLIENGVRMWGYSERHIYDPIYTSFDPSEDIPYIHKPNLVHARARYFRYLDMTAWAGWRPRRTLKSLSLGIYESVLREILYPAEKWRMQLIRRRVLQRDDLEKH
jgi:hypothetical protein